MGLNVYIEEIREGENTILMDVEGEVAHRIKDYMETRYNYFEYNKEYEVAEGPKQFYRYLADIRDEFDEQRIMSRENEEKFELYDSIVERVTWVMDRVVEGLWEVKETEMVKYIYTTWR